MRWVNWKTFIYGKIYDASFTWECVNMCGKIFKNILTIRQFNEQFVYKTSTGGDIQCDKFSERCFNDAHIRYVCNPIKYINE
jgi:hypothetical protein